MKKQKRQMLLLLAALVILIGGYFGVKYYNENAASGETEPETETEYVLNVEDESITRITYSYEEEEYTFIKEEGTWKYEADPSLAILQTYIKSMENNVEAMIAKETFEKVTDPSVYGLDKPERYFSFTSEGKEYKFLVGIRNTYTNDYYICQEGSDTVYMVSSQTVTRFNKTLEDVLDTPEESTEAAQ